MDQWGFSDMATLVETFSGLADIVQATTTFGISSLAQLQLRIGTLPV
jgi:hypothetical protein